MFPPTLLAMMSLVSGFYYSWMVYVATRLEVPEFLGEEPLPIDEIARRCQAHPDTLYRFLRALAVLEIVEEVEPRRFKATEHTAWFRAGVRGGLRSHALLGGERAIWEAWNGLYDAVRTGEPAFNTVHGTGFFDYLATRPDLNTLFQESSRGLPVWNTAIARAYDFSGRRRLVDVGGSDGILAQAILDHYPDLEATVFERPDVVELFRSRPECRHPRLTWATGDFLEAVPAGGDLYLMRFILHDWDDARAVRILRNCRAVMEDDARILVLENVIDPSEKSPTALLDMSLLVLTGGRERTEDEYSNLFEQAGFSLEEAIPTAVGVSIIVGKPA